MPSVEICAILPKTTVKMDVVSSGWMIAHAGPRIVCLYMATNVRRASR